MQALASGSKARLTVVGFRHAISPSPVIMSRHLLNQSPVHPRSVTTAASTQELAVTRLPSSQTSTRNSVGVDGSFGHRTFNNPVLSSRIFQPGLLRTSQIRLASTAANPSPISSTFSQQANSKSSSSEAEPESDATEPDPDEPQPTSGSAYARFKALAKKYGWWAFGMYWVLSLADFSLVFLLVHTAGLERIEPYYQAGLYQFRVAVHGREGADDQVKQDQEKKRIEAETKRKAKEEEARMTPEELAIRKKEHPKGWISRTLAAEIALSYAIHKVGLLPVRAGLTVAWTPKLVKWLASRGWVGKGGITRAATHAQGKIKGASDRVRDRVRDLRD